MTRIKKQILPVGVDLKPGRWSDYESSLLRWLEDSDHANQYLNAALEDGDRQVLMSVLQQIKKVHGSSRSADSQELILRCKIILHTLELQEKIGKKPKLKVSPAAVLISVPLRK